MLHIEEGQLHAYLEGEATEHEREEIEGHLSGCAECRARLEQAKRVAQRSAELLGELEPGPLRSAPWQEIEARTPARRAKARRSPWLNPGLAWAASIALAFGLGWLARTRVVPPEGLLELARMQAERPAAETGPVAVFETQPMTPAATAPERSQEAAKEAPRTAPELKVARREPTTVSDRAKVEPAPADRAAQEATGEPEAGEKLTGAVADVAFQAPAVAEPKPIEPRVARTEIEEHALPSEIRVPRRRGRAAEDEGRADRLFRETLTERGSGDPAIVATESFITAGLDEAEAWLGAPLRTLPELSLESVEIGPGSAVRAGVSGRPAIRLIYLDAAGHEIALIQQLATGQEADELAEPALVVHPSGLKAYRWTDGRGYRLTLTGALSSDSLRALAERVR